MSKNVLDLYRADVPSSKPISGGKEWKGPCPKCGGDPGKSDRFSVWPNEGKTGQYWCRSAGCELHKRGDAIEYLRQVKGMSYPEACAELDIELKKPPLKSLSPSQGNIKAQDKAQDWEPHGWAAPSEQWQQQASRLLSRCIQQLLDDDHQHIRDWLRQSRCIDEESARGAYLGYCPRDIHLDRVKWGLPAEVDSKGKPRPLWIPEGIVIPCYRDRVIHRLRVRRFAPKNGKKYIFIQGGSALPYVLKTGAECTVIVESELDAILINQEAGALVNTVALGSVSMRPDPELHELLKGQRSVLVALDVDFESLAGAKAAWGWWAQHYPNALRCAPVGGKDPTEMLKHGHDIKLWIQAALAGGAQRMKA